MRWQVSSVSIRLSFGCETMRSKTRTRIFPGPARNYAPATRLGAERFGWSQRSAVPGSQQEGTTGWSGTVWRRRSIRHIARRPACRLILFANGSAVVRTAASDMGPGTYTAMTQLAADALGLPMERVHFELGDTDMPKAPVHGGSITLASVGNAVVSACRNAADEAWGRARADPVALMRAPGVEKLEAEGQAGPGDETKTYSSSAFGAVFVEVLVDPAFGVVRVPRIIGAYDIGTVVNPKIARSQCIGGMVGGVGMALMEQAEWDAHLGRIMNANLAEYLVPVNADIQELDVLFVPGEDKIFNPLGSKGVAEIALTGVAPAIANAVYNATGHRNRHLPITPDRLLNVL